MLILMLYLAGSCGAFDDFEIFHDIRRTYELNLNLTMFPSLDNYQVNATPATEESYPWIARVIHSTTSNIPHICTAACVADAIFVTAARCIYSLKVMYTTVMHKSKQLPVRAFVLPSNFSSQLFDDVGFIVLEDTTNDPYDTINTFFDKQRTDATFRWFDDMDLSDDFKVVGYAIPKAKHYIKEIDKQYNLTELAVVVAADLCPNILTFNNKFEGFDVPCYHSCNLTDFKAKADVCMRYHGVEGAALIDSKNRLFGIATWGTSYHKYDFPVGFSALNSKAFFEDFECAKKIRNADGAIDKPGYYQSLCGNAR